MNARLVLIPAALCLAFLFPPPEARAERKNPHRDIPCMTCHVKLPERPKTGSGKVPEDMRKGPVEICRDCHPESETSHHPVVKKTKRRLPEGLPLSPGGEVICSTCHDIHQQKVTAYLLRGFDTGRYFVRMDMCLDCHGDEFGGIDPHNAGAESGKCHTCHVGKPGAEETSGKVRIQENLEKICDFCHNVRAKAHPSNVDAMMSLPSELPRGRNGEAMCGTCHDPHGTPGTIHFLRKRYVQALERGRYANPHGKPDYGACLGCHIEVSLKKEQMRSNMRYGGDDMRICHSCHGAMEACHPVLILLPATMKPGEGLPLTADGKIKCLTCHDPKTEGGGGGVTVRRKEKGEPVNAICFRCHNRAELASRNPHTTMADRDTCRFCHDTMTDPTNEEAGRVSFISNTRLICLRCHAQDYHPMGVNHMVPPKQELPEVFRLDNRGRMTCTTCHNPHIDTRENKERSRRFVIEGKGSDICSRCHKR